MKFKALKDLAFPKFDIKVKKGEMLDLTDEQFTEVKIFYQILFKEVKAEVVEEPKTKKKAKKAK